MKYIIIILIIFLSHVNTTYAQGDSTTKEFKIGSAKQLNIESDYGDVTINIWDQTNVKVEASVIVNGKNEIQAFEIEGRLRGDRYNIETEINFDEIEQMISIKEKDGSWTMYTEEEYKKIEGRKHHGLNYGRDSSFKCVSV